MNKPRIVYLADAGSIHTRRWVSYFVAQGYEAHVFSFLPGEIPGAQVYYLRAGSVRTEGGNWRYLAHLPTLHRRVRALRPALVHAHYLTSYGLLGALIDCHPLVMTAWGSDVLVTPQRSPLYRRLLRFTLRQADLVTSDAETMSRALERYGVPPERVLTIPLGIDLNLFRRERHDWTATGDRLISTRRLVPNTNLETVLRALPHVVQTLPDIHLDVVGDGPEEPNLRVLARRLNLDRVVTWHGQVAHDALPGLLGQTGIYLAVTHSDSTSVSMLEAMACGLFPIVTDLPANREWIESGVNGLLVPPDDEVALAQAIVRAAQDPQWRENAGRQNRQAIARRANWHENMAQVAQAYQALIAQHSHADSQAQQASIRSWSRGFSRSVRPEGSTPGDLSRSGEARKR